VVGLDVRALLLGAAAMTKRFLEEPFDRNPVLQFAAVNHLMTEELGKRTRVMAVWGRKLEGIGHWYDHVVGESLGKSGKGPTPMTLVASRDLYSRGQLLQEGCRDKLINNLYVRTVKHNPIMIGMADRNEDELNAISRKGFPDLMEAAFVGTNRAFEQTARPSTDMILPALNEHTLGQLMQMLMLATVVEGRLANTNPYGQPGAEPFQRHTLAELRATPNLPKGEVRDAAKGV
jgi:glucose-6-phosphate isomerase